jgi:hypothetical protein
MADASRLKGLRRGGLGAPPSLDEARADLAHSVEQPGGDVAASHGSFGSVSEGRPGAPRPGSGPRIDGRTMRRSGRTVQFATRVSPEFDERVRQIAMRDGLLLVEVLERALAAYESSNQATR